MYQSMRLETVRLRESGMADVTSVGFLPGVYPEMSLQFECIGTRVRTMGTLEWKGLRVIRWIFGLPFSP